MGGQSPPTAEAGALGLTAREVASRVERGQANHGGPPTSRTVGEILRANLATRFNAILGVLLIVILAVGDPQDALFGIVLVSNALIGIVQELRAKRTLDRLAVVSAPRARALRDGAVHELPVEDVVLDDLLEVHTGDQVVVDGLVRSSTGLQVDESLLTGEADPVDKVVGDELLSGSFVVAGSGRFQATAVGPAAYGRRIASEARRFTMVRSELMDGINRMLRYVTWVIVPAAALLLVSQLRSDNAWRDAVSGAVAGVVGMVPQGLVLLTSIAFAVAAVSLARRGVLAQELPAVEGLARVDVVCFDKTGTLTDGTITFSGIEAIDPHAPAEAGLAALADEEGGNATLAAIARAVPPSFGWVRTAAVPFSSARKWSAASFEGHGTWVLGAPELIAPEGSPGVARAAVLADAGHRVLLLAHTEASLDGDRMPSGTRAVALALLDERVRPDARETLAYFAGQGVAVKVISGDSPRTLAAVAAAVGLPDAGGPVDARELPTDEHALGVALEERSIFGRVTPAQKRAMVTALQARGHTVAMTGDGVNDALALKLADVGIAMGSGAAATRAVAQLILLDGRFATLPGVVAEGRRVTANIERVANLFIAKTVWATVLAVAIGVVGWPYPFLPRHLSIIDSLSIGIPAFFLALGPNLRRYIPGFVGRVLRFTVPAGLAIALAAFGAFWAARNHGLPLTEQRTAATLVTLALSLCVLVIMARPVSWRSGVLVAGAVAALAVLLASEPARTFCALAVPNGTLGTTMAIAAAGVAVLAGGWVVAQRLGRDGPART